MVCHEPVESQVCEFNPEHCTDAGTHEPVHAPEEHTYGHVLPLSQVLPEGSHVWTTLLWQRSDPGEQSMPLVSLAASEVPLSTAEASEASAWASATEESVETVPSAASAPLSEGALPSSAASAAPVSPTEPASTCEAELSAPGSDGAAPPQPVRTPSTTPRSPSRDIATATCPWESVPPTSHLERHAVYFQPLG